MEGLARDIIFEEINSDLESIIRASSTLVKLKGKDDRLTSILQDAYKKDPLNIEKICAYSFYLWFLADNNSEDVDLSDTNSVFQVSFNLINLLDETLKTNPEYWILWILKPELFIEL